MPCTTFGGDPRYYNKEGHPKHLSTAFTNHIYHTHYIEITRKGSTGTTPTPVAPQSSWEIRSMTTSPTTHVMRNVHALSLREPRENHTTSCKSSFPQLQCCWFDHLWLLNPFDSPMMMLLISRGWPPNCKSYMSCCSIQVWTSFSSVRS